MKKLILFITLALSLTVNAQTDSTSLKKTDEVLSTILTKSLVLAEKTGSFVMEQAPDLLKEFYAWHTASNIFGIICAIVLMIIVVCCKKYEYGDIYPTIIFVIFGAFVSIIMFLCCTYDLVQLLVAPKLYLIEYFANKIN